MFDFVKLRHKICSATWNDGVGQWELEIEDTANARKFIDRAEVLINAGGFLKLVVLVSISSTITDKCKQLEVARCAGARDIQRTVDPFGEMGRLGILQREKCGCHRVWVVGDPDRSAVTKRYLEFAIGFSRVAKTAAAEVDHLVSFNRSPTWITPEFAAELAPQGRQTLYSEAQKEEWRHDTDKFLNYRKTVEGGANRFFDLQLKDSDMQRQLFERFSRDMSEILDKKSLGSIVVPKFAVGCRR